MATLDMAAKLAVLDQARQRLEAELERDEHWRALQKPLPSTDATEFASEKEARDHRLRQALEANPVYVAWRNVVEASATLQKTGANDGAFDGPVEPAQAVVTQLAERKPEPPKPEPDRGSLSAALQGMLADEDVAEADAGSDRGHSDGLPPEIAALLREEVRAGSAPSTLSESDRELHAVGERAARAVEKLLAIPSVEPVAREHLETARRADRLASELREINDRRRARSAQRNENEIVTETAPTERRAAEPANPNDDVDFLLNPAGAPWVPFDNLGDPEETVATVMARPEHLPREPVGEPQRRGKLVERLRAEEMSATVPPSSSERTQRLSVTHEAEVTVVRKSQDNVPTVALPPPVPEEKPPQRPFRRLINALTGK